MKKIILGLVIIIFALYAYSTFLTKGMVVGTYVNRNFKRSDTKGIPHFPDTIKLFNDGSYNSGYWENGAYKIWYTPLGTMIELKHKDSFHASSIQKIIGRNNIIGNPKIIVDNKANQYFEKID